MLLFFDGVNIHDAYIKYLYLYFWKSITKFTLKKREQHKHTWINQNGGSSIIQIRKTFSSRKSMLSGEICTPLTLPPRLNRIWLEVFQYLFLCIASDWDFKLEWELNYNCFFCSFMSLACAIAPLYYDTETLQT